VSLYDKIKRMGAWRTGRQITYLIIFIMLVGLPAGLYVYFKTPAPSCSDKIQNQDEFGIDCGGSCARVCAEEVASLVTFWQKSFFVRDGFYDLAALIENPNSSFTATSFSYTWSVYDKNNRLINTVAGKSFANAREKFIIFEPQVSIGGSVPAHAFIEIKDTVWERVANVEKPRILVEDEELSLTGAPKLTAILSNDTPETLGHVEAVATIFNEENNIIGVSRTIVSNLMGDVPQKVFFTWPKEFTEEPRICLKPVEVMLVFDRSGSMNDDEGASPEPITSAQNAAKLFINQLGSRDKVGLVSFARDASDPIDAPLSSTLEDVKRAVSDIHVRPEDEKGFTNLGGGLRAAGEELARSIREDSTRKIIVALTDGKANYPSTPGGEAYAKSEADTIRKNGVEIYAIGLGDKVNEPFLKDSIASRKENYFFSATREELADVYARVARDVCPNRVYLTHIFVRVLDEASR